MNETLLTDCTLCPRNCHVNRLAGETGFCGQTAQIKAARAALHMWEEPCISGSKGSGTVFFTGCNLKCLYCQNHTIAIGKTGQSLSQTRLADIFLTLQEQGANNINLVTPSHFIPQIAASLEEAKNRGLFLPIVYNTGSYESVEALRLLEGLVDVYLPDLKYFSTELSTRYSNAPDYFDRASAAIAEMFRQVGEPVFFSTQDSPVTHDPVTVTDSSMESSLSLQPEPGIMKKGVIVRHLLLPGQSKDTKKILRYLHTTYQNQIYISIMSQYTPLPHVAAIPELNCKVSSEAYEKIVDFALRIGIENGFFQEGDVSDDSFIPPFDATGL